MAHHLINRTDDEVHYLEIGNRDPADQGEYTYYDLSALAMFAIVQPGDTLDTLGAGIGWLILHGTPPRQRRAIWASSYETDA